MISVSYTHLDVYKRQRVYKKFELCGVSKIDFIIDKEKGPMVIGINTLHGICLLYTSRCV